MSVEPFSAGWRGRALQRANRWFRRAEAWEPLLGSKRRTSTRAGTRGFGPVSRRGVDLQPECRLGLVVDCP